MEGPSNVQSHGVIRQSLQKPSTADPMKAMEGLDLSNNNTKLEGSPMMTSALLRIVASRQITTTRLSSATWLMQLFNLTMAPWRTLVARWCSLRAKVILPQCIPSDNVICTRTGVREQSDIISIPTTWSVRGTRSWSSGKVKVHWIPPTVSIMVENWIGAMPENQCYHV